MLKQPKRNSIIGVNRRVTFYSLFYSGRCWNNLILNRVNELLGDSVVNTRESDLYFFFCGKRRVLCYFFG